jgi:hypothetical protein
MSSRRLGPVAIIVLAFCACARSGTGSNKAFGTPEAAIEHYVKSIAAADVDAAMTAFAVHDVAAHYDYAAVARFLPPVNPFSLYAPTHHDLYVRLNEMRLTAEAANAVKVYTYGLLVDPALEQAPAKPPTEADIAAFMAALDPSRLKALKLVRIDSAMKTAAANPEFLASQKRHAAFNGADEQTERLALYQLGQQSYSGGFQLLRYGNRWVISQPFSLLAHGPILAKTTPAEYEARLK